MSVRPSNKKDAHHYSKDYTKYILEEEIKSKILRVSRLSQVIMEAWEVLLENHLLCERSREIFKLDLEGQCQSLAELRSARS